MKRRNDIGILIIIGIILIAFAMFVSATYTWIDNVNNITYYATEDSIYNHNLSNNITGSGSATFSIRSNITELPILWNGTNINYTSISSWIYISNSTTGDFVINATQSNQTGNFTIPIEVASSGSSQTLSFNFSVASVNDAPLFVGLQDKQMNATFLFNYAVNVTDEESNSPYNLNISFVNCSTAEWSDRNSTNCTLFNSSNYTFNNNTGMLNISFTPARNDVGNYTLNFSVTDVNGSVNNSLVIFRVLNVNLEPSFNYVCNNERNWTEGNNVLCYVNISDDEPNSITISSGEPTVVGTSTTSYPTPGWFIFDGTGMNNASKTVNLSTGYNASYLVNFTSTDRTVGNWSVTLTLTDSGVPVKTNSSTIYFFINNTPDNVSLGNISDLTVPITSNSTINVFAYDDDLLINDANLYDENLTFYSNTSWVRLASKNETPNTNISNGLFTVYPNSSLLGDHYVNISVFDKNNVSSGYKVFLLTVQNNSAPVWSVSQSNLMGAENSLFYLNLSSNVSDSDDGDNLTFTYSCSSCFDGSSTFNLNSTTGIINFTPSDIDVGNFSYIITATDSRNAYATQSFNFTINNTLDNVSINEPLTNCSSGFSINSTNSNIVTSEDNLTCIELNIQDGDMAIIQKNFYDETLTLMQTSSPNISLINFTLFNSGITSSYRTNFTPAHANIGNYTVTLNVTDATGNSDGLTFNLTINPTPHAPVLSDITNQAISILEGFYYDVNATDTEDGTDINGSFNYTLIPLNAGTFLSVNSTTGLITNSSNVISGIWNYTIIVNDSSGLNDSSNFTLTIYDYPHVLSPLVGLNFSLSENNTYMFNFSANHSVADNLNYSLYFNGVLKNSTSGYGNSTNISLSYTPSFTDETTCSGIKNLTLNVSNSKLSNSSSWSTEINHTNYPVTLISNLGEGNPLTVEVTNKRTLDLTNYFYDLDAVDSCINQSVNFTAQPLGANTVTTIVNNWINGSNPNITFSSGVAVDANYSILAREYNISNPSETVGNVTSNNFTVSIDIQTTTVTISGSGGGDGGTQIIVTPIVLKLLLPGPVNSDKKDSLSVPIKVTNTGSQSITGINLSSFVTFNGSNVSGINSRFDIPYIESLSQGETKNVTLFIESDVESQGSYEITINASAKSPAISDWGKIYLNVKEGAAVERKILFTEQLILDNPECAELTEIINSARTDFDSGKINEAEKKIDEAINSCKRSIEQVGLGSRIGKVLGGNRTFTYVALLSFIAAGIGILFYIYRRMKLRRTLMGYD